ncbi:MAG: hypothetical protein R3E58_12950 [Phycisphaerae bacterium]
MIALPMLSTIATSIGMTREIVLLKTWREPSVMDLLGGRCWR